MTPRQIGPRLILIDGYNVIRRTPGLAFAERGSLAAGRDALLTLVTGRYRGTPHHVVIVFDGDGDRERTEPAPRLPRGKVVFTVRGESADCVIKRLAEEQTHGGLPVVAVSDDMEVRQDASSVGGRSAAVGELTSRLNEPDKYRRRQDIHRRAIREQWQRDADDAPRGPRKGNPRRPPKRTQGQHGHGLP